MKKKEDKYDAMFREWHETYKHAQSFWEDADMDDDDDTMVYHQNSIYAKSLKAYADKLVDTNEKFKSQLPGYPDRFGE